MVITDYPAFDSLPGKGDNPSLQKGIIFAATVIYYFDSELRKNTVDENRQT